MATQRQKKVAKLIAENAGLAKPLNGGQIVENSRYSKSMQIKPGIVLNSQGVTDELEILGFTEENAKTVVTEIMLNRRVNPQARLKATEQVFKVKGSFAPEKRDITTGGEKLSTIPIEAIAIIEEDLKGKKTK